MTFHPTLRSDLACLAGRRISLAPPLPLIVPLSSRIITLDRSEYVEIPPAHVVDAVQRRGK